MSYLELISTCSSCERDLTDAVVVNFVENKEGKMAVMCTECKDKYFEKEEVINENR